MRNAGIKKLWITSCEASVNVTASYGQMQRVDFAFSLRMLDLPHPLFADDVDLQCVRRRNFHVEIGLGSRMAKNASAMKMGITVHVISMHSVGSFSGVRSARALRRYL